MDTGALCVMQEIEASVDAALITKESETRVGVKMLKDSCRFPFTKIITVAQKILLFLNNFYIKEILVLRSFTIGSDLLLSGSLCIGALQVTVCVSLCFMRYTLCRL